MSLILSAWTSITYCRRMRATALCCRQVGCQCDKWPLTIASTVNVVRPTTVQFIALTVHLYRAEMTTCYDDLRAVAKFLVQTSHIESIRIANWNALVFSLLPRLLTSWLPAFAAERRAAAPLLLSASVAPATADQYLLSARRSAANPPDTAAAVDQWDRRTLDRLIDYAGSVNNSANDVSFVGLTTRMTSPSHAAWRHTMPVADASVRIHGRCSAHATSRTAGCNIPVYMWLLLLLNIDIV